jgi:hypothetical protein
MEQVHPNSRRSYQCGAMLHPVTRATITRASIALCRYESSFAFGSCRLVDYFDDVFIYLQYDGYSYSYIEYIFI